MNGKSKSLALALLLGAFVIGGLVGAVADRTLVRGPSAEPSEERRGRDRDRRQSYLDWLSSELDLTDEQREHVAAVLERNREEVRALWRETRPAFEELKIRLRAQVREGLSEQQRAAYDSLLAKEHDRHRRRR